MRVRFSDAAEADLEGIGDYIAEDSPIRAARELRELRASGLALAERPYRFPVAALGDGNMRRRIVGSYAIYYVVEGDFVNIVRVLHSARDHRAIFDD